MMMMVLGALAALLLLALVGSGVFWVLVQLGVIAQKAMEPPAQDAGSYSLDQGHDVSREK